MPPITIATNAQRPTARVGSTQPLSRMFTINRTKESSEISMRSQWTGSRAFKSV